jgi:hypothetical protein
MVLQQVQLLLSLQSSVISFALVSTCCELPAVIALEKDVRSMEGIQEEVFVKGFGKDIIASIILNLSNCYIP